VFLVIFTVVVLIGALVTMVAWNLVMPALFNLPAISYLQAIAVNVLLGLIRQTVITVKK
jgi:hypothetical protein